MFVFGPVCFMAREPLGTKAMSLKMMPESSWRAADFLVSLNVGRAGGMLMGIFLSRAKEGEESTGMKALHGGKTEYVRCHQICTVAPLRTEVDKFDSTPPPPMSIIGQ